MVGSIIAALIAYAPAFVKLALYILDANGASQAQKQQFLNMILAAQDDANVSVQMKDQFAALRQQLKDQNVQNKNA